MASGRRAESGKFCAYSANCFSARSQTSVLKACWAALNATLSPGVAAPSRRCELASKARPKIQQQALFKHALDTFNHIKLVSGWRLKEKESLLAGNAEGDSPLISVVLKTGKSQPSTCEI